MHLVISGVCPLMLYCPCPASQHVSTMPTVSSLGEFMIGISCHTRSLQLHHLRHSKPPWWSIWTSHVRHVFNRVLFSFCKPVFCLYSQVSTLCTSFLNTLPWRWALSPVLSPPLCFPPYLPFCIYSSHCTLLITLIAPPPCPVWSESWLSSYLPQPEMTTVSNVIPPSGILQGYCFTKADSLIMLHDVESLSGRAVKSQTRFLDQTWIQIPVSTVVAAKVISVTTWPNVD